MTEYRCTKCGASVKVDTDVNPPRYDYHYAGKASPLNPNRVAGHKCPIQNMGHQMEALGGLDQWAEQDLVEKVG